MLHGHLGGELKSCGEQITGQTWSDITPTNINGQDWIPYDITITDSDNENTLWIARTSMYGGVQDLQGYEVFKSSDGGITWNNWSTLLLII